jgi:hypothetical protein
MNGAERMEGEFRAMKLILKALAEHVPNLTPSGRRWLREKFEEMMKEADEGGGG